MLTLADKLRMWFDYDFPGVHDLRTRGVWAARRIAGIWWRLQQVHHQQAAAETGRRDLPPPAAIDPADRGTHPALPARHATPAMERRDGRDRRSPDRRLPLCRSDRAPTRHSNKPKRPPKASFDTGARWQAEALFAECPTAQERPATPDTPAQVLVCLTGDRRFTSWAPNIRPPAQRAWATDSCVPDSRGSASPR